MPAISTLPALMYRPGWTRFTLSGQVRRCREGREPSEAVELSGSLATATGGRYRADLADEDGDRTLDICDGQSVWTVCDGMAVRRTAGDPSVPFRELLNPAWVLAGFDLDITGQCEHAGRSAYTAVGSPRVTRKARGGTGRSGERLSALIDTELGILLRYEKTGQGIRAETAEFTALRVDAPGAADPALFAPPQGVQFTENDKAPQPPAEPAPAGTGGALSDDMVNLLYRAGLGPQKFSAQLHERADGDAIARQMQATAASATNRAVRRVVQYAADHAEGVDLTARLAVAMPGCYQIEAITDPGRRPSRLACDGEYQWRVFPDRTYRWPAAPPPAGLALLIDPAWLLDQYLLSAEGTVSVAGRPGLRIVAKPADGTAQQGDGPASRIIVAADSIEAVIDLQLGIALRLVWSYDGQPLLSAELSGVTADVDPAVFRVEPPPGTRVITTMNPLAAISAKEAAGIAAKIVTDIGKWMRGPQR